MWPWGRLKADEPTLADEIFTGIIETLMRIDANVQALVYDVEAGDDED
jgi:hypothetical protein